jgi:hypothetical protein|tara:strand:+ start:19204 stop:19647 length:444 start_codon:yes stop_codon:yes gene_type:complete
MINFKHLLIFSLIGLSTFGVSAEEKTYKDIRGYRIFYSSFNSSFILPEIASIYSITRGKDKGLVTIAITKSGKIGGKKALISGTASNMLQQQQQLNFIEIKEDEAIYYLAPFEYYNEDTLTFKIEIETEPNQPSISVSFQNKFYYEK